MASSTGNRFENAVKDIQDCQDHLFEPLSPEEELARDHLLQVCREIGTAARQITSVKNRPGLRWIEDEPGLNYPGG